jgi:peptidyl-dipeptidase A
MPTLQSFIDRQKELVESLEIASSAAYWNATITGSKEDEALAASLGAELRTTYSSAEYLSFLVSTEVPDDPSLARQRKILIDSFRTYQISPDVIKEISNREMEIEGIFSNFRAELNGTPVSENELSKILKESVDVVERQSAWTASKQIGAVAEPKVLALVALRNAEARRLGYSNYYSMQMELQEIDEDWLFTALESLGEQLEPQFAEYKSELDEELSSRYSVTPDQLRPWHYADPFFQTAPPQPNSPVDSYFEGKNLEEIAKRFYSDIGFNVSTILQNSDLYEKPGKMQHAYCTSIGRAHDIRMLCNLVSNSQWMGTLLHELGHAIYDDHLDDNLPFFVRTVAHTMTTEAIAEMMGRLVDSGAWLKKYVGVSDGEAERVSESTSRAHKAHLLVFSRWVLVMVNFERELYRESGEDLDNLWWHFVEKYQLLRRPDFPLKGVWASKIHLASAPVYYHNYLLGEMMASQFVAAIIKDEQLSEEEVVNSSKVGKWLTERIFRPGATFPWDELVMRATGEPLNPSYIVRELI